MIILTETRHKKGEQSTTKKEIITKRQFNNITSDETLKWFRRFGGSETAQRGYTSQGYNVYRLISRSPSRDCKTVRDFNFVDFPSYKAEVLFENLLKGMNQEGLFQLKRFKRLLTLDEVKQIINAKLN